MRDKNSRTANCELRIANRRWRVFQRRAVRQLRDLHAEILRLRVSLLRRCSERRRLLRACVYQTNSRTIVSSKASDACSMDRVFPKAAQCMELGVFDRHAQQRWMSD